MSAKELQEMENPVTRGAKSGDGMKKVDDSTSPGASASYEDLGGPTPENYKPDNDSAKLKEPKIKTVSDVVNRGAGKADAMQSIGTEVLKQGDEPAKEDSAEVVAETPSEEETTPTVDVEQDLAALFGGEELSEEFQAKAKTIFEAAVTEKVNAVKEEMTAEFEKTMSEQLESTKADLIERTDAYLEYVSSEWMSENKIEVEHGLKTEMTESFLTGMKSLFEDHYVSIPEDKYDVVENMVDKLDEMESKLNEQIEKNIAITKSLSEATGGNILSDVSEGLSSTQKEKLASLAEGVEFESEESYKEKLETLKESYFKAAPKRSDSEVLNESAASPEVSGSMAAYIQALSHATKK